MDYAVIIDELRRKAEALNQAADVLEETFVVTPASLGRPTPRRWEPGLGAAVDTIAEEHRRATEERVPKPAAKVGRKKPPSPTSGKPDQDTFRRYVEASKYVLSLNVHDAVLSQTIKNYLEGQGLPYDVEVAVEAMATAQEELRV